MRSSYRERESSRSLETSYEQDRGFKQRNRPNREESNTERTREEHGNERFQPEIRGAEISRRIDSEWGEIEISAPKIKLFFFVPSRRRKGMGERRRRREQHLQWNVGQGVGKGKGSELEYIPKLGVPEVGLKGGRTRPTRSFCWPHRNAACFGGNYRVCPLSFFSREIFD